MGPTSFLNKLFMQKLHRVKIQRQQHLRLKEAVISWQTCKVQDKFRKILYFKSLSLCNVTWHGSEVNMNNEIQWFQIILFKYPYRKKNTEIKQNLTYLHKWKLILYIFFPSVLFTKSCSASWYGQKVSPSFLWENREGYRWPPDNSSQIYFLAWMFNQGVMGKVFSKMAWFHARKVLIMC